MSCVYVRPLPHQRGSAIPLRSRRSHLHLHVENVGRRAERAIQAGATYLMEPADLPHGEGQCRLRDPLGHKWLLGHPLEEVSRDEMQRRYTEQRPD